MVDSTMTGTGGSLVQRMIRAARLDNGLYEEVEADRTATGQAATAVVIVAIAGAIGQGLSVALQGQGGVLGILLAAIGAAVGSLLGWVIWSYVSHFIGTRFFGGTADPGELLRTIGFAQAPGVLNILIFVPAIGAVIPFVTMIWSLVAGVIAIRQALDFDTGKAILTAVIGAIFFFIVFVIITAVIAGLLVALSGGVPTG
jgi:hypothetical protein